ncbi:MAG: hypothetical protein ACR2H1_13710 [Limisphaerales bacterium]
MRTHRAIDGLGNRSYTKAQQNWNVGQSVSPVRAQPKWSSLLALKCSLDSGAPIPL